MHNTQNQYWIPCILVYIKKISGNQASRNLQTRHDPDTYGQSLAASIYFIKVINLNAQLDGIYNHLGEGPLECACGIEMLF